jgi:hypothetical protein
MPTVVPAIIDIPIVVVIIIPPIVLMVIPTDMSTVIRLGVRSDVLLRNSKRFPQVPPRFLSQSRNVRGEHASIREQPGKSICRLEMIHDLLVQLHR